MMEGSTKCMAMRPMTSYPTKSILLSSLAHTHSNKLVKKHFVLLQLITYTTKAK